MINLLYFCMIAPDEIKQDVYNVMTNSRELTNYCQESINSIQSKKISNSLNNFHLQTAVDFITKSLADEDRLFFESNDIYFDNHLELKNKPIYNKVINYIENYLIEFN